MFDGRLGNDASFMRLSNEFVPWTSTSSDAAWVLAPVEPCRLRPSGHERGRPVHFTCALPWAGRPSVSDRSYPSRPEEVIRLPLNARPAGDQAETSAGG